MIIKIAKDVSNSVINFDDNFTFRTRPSFESFHFQNQSSGGYQDATDLESETTLLLTLIDRIMPEKINFDSAVRSDVTIKKILRATKKYFD